METRPWRNSSQYLLEGRKEISSKGTYDIYPSFNIGQGKIFRGFDELAERIKNKKNLIIDAYLGVFMLDFQQKLDRALRAKGVKVLWWHTSAAMKPAEDIQEMITPYLGGDDPVFGKLATPLQLSDFFIRENLEAIQPDPDSPMNILIGYGASLFQWDGDLVYIDLPKNELQFRARAHSISNFGADQCFDVKQMYKRFYFVDWVVFNKHKKDILPEIDLFIDGQNPESPVWATGDTLREALHSMAGNVFRVRPWFEPGVWGGTWIKENIRGLNQDVPNYAWSFELIVPENGLLIESDYVLMEVSFDSIMYLENESVLGKHTRMYGDVFPIRFDFLDTFDGGNLSVQCHPRLEYMKENFGESITQEETYYLLDCKEDAGVYLGFQENIDPVEFRKALEWSAQTGQEIDIGKYVQRLEAHKHDLFLIPPGTIHGSGKNNLVLEISATPYIYTFKLYDWARLDLDGKPRPINIDRGMDNLCFDRCGQRVRDELVSVPKILFKGEDWQLYHLPTHADHLYDVHRYHFNTEIHIKTEGIFHVLSLVKGSSVRVITESGHQQRFHYAETFVIPAAAGSYSVINEDEDEAMLIKAFCKSCQ